MPNHVHLLLLPSPGIELADTLRKLNGGFSHRALQRWRDLDDAGAKVLSRITDARGRPRFWQHGGGYDHNVREYRSLSHILDYLHNNPVRRELCAAPDDWRWSSARWYARLDYTGPRINPPD